MIETIWTNIRNHEGELFHTIGKNALELTYQVVDDEHLVFSRTAERVSKKQIERVLENKDVLTPAQINQKIRASYYILALLQDPRIV